jgi:Heterokaryon incompatibility protein (HET)
MALEPTPSSLKRQPFAYRPLVENAIRLALLHPASDVSTQLECSMEHVTLSQCNQDLINNYTALSYVWGDSTDRRHIIVDGCSFDITANLDSALRHIRDEKGIIKIWADALCINQSDTTERNHQVQQMGSVYSIASHTVIYLGAPSRETDALLTELSSLVYSLCTKDLAPLSVEPISSNYSEVALGALCNTIQTHIVDNP